MTSVTEQLILSYESVELVCVLTSAAVSGQMCGLVVLGFGVYLLLNFRMAALTPNLAGFNSANVLLVTGIVISCVSFLGLMGALKENRCLLLTVRNTCKVS